MYTPFIFVITFHDLLIKAELAFSAITPLQENMACTRIELVMLCKVVSKMYIFYTYNSKSIGIVLSSDEIDLLCYSD